MNTAPTSSSFLLFHADVCNATWDVIDHSPQVDAIQRAFAECHALLATVSSTVANEAPLSHAPPGYAPPGHAPLSEALPRLPNADGFVERAMSLLLLHDCDFTATDFRLIGWSNHDRSPRAWGCYRIQHTPSQQWLELVVSHVQTAHPNGDGRLLLNSIALSLDAAINQLGSAEWPRTSDAIGDRPTMPAALANEETVVPLPHQAAAPHGSWNGPGLAESAAPHGAAFVENETEAVSASFDAA